MAKKAPLYAGMLRHRILIQEPVDMRDSAGELVRAWQDLSEVWASIEPMSSTDLFASKAAQSKATTRIRIRYRSDVLADMRIVYRSTIYHIVGLIPDPDSGIEYLTLLCESGVSIEGD